MNPSEDQIKQDPDSFEQAQQDAPEGSPARHPNRAQSEGAFEAAGAQPAQGWVERGDPPLDEAPEQALDEALELTFPGSDPVAGPQGCTRVEIGRDGLPHEVASGAQARADA